MQTRTSLEGAVPLTARLGTSRLFLQVVSMTQLSKALTAETAEERAEALRNEVHDLLGVTGGPMPEAVGVMMVEQFYTNERTLFIAAEEGRLAVQGVPAHMNPAQGDREADRSRLTSPLETGEPRQAGTASTGGIAPPASPPNHPLTPADSALDASAKASGPAPLALPAAPPQAALPPMRPLTPASPGWQPSIGCTVEELKKYGGLSDAWGLPKPMWVLLCKDWEWDYPKEPSKRLELLSKLTPQQRGELLGTVKR